MYFSLDNLNDDLVCAGSGRGDICHAYHHALGGFCGQMDVVQLGGSRTRSGLDVDGSRAQRDLRSSMGARQIPSSSL